MRRMIPITFSPVFHPDPGVGAAPAAGRVGRSNFTERPRLRPGALDGGRPGTTLDQRDGRCVAGLLLDGEDGSLVERPVVAFSRGSWTAARVGAVGSGARRRISIA